MTNFLPAGIIAERLAELVDQVHQLETLTAEPEMLSQLSEIKRIAEELVLFIEGFSCQPLIYTGEGTTEEVISRLEWLLAFSDEGKAEILPRKRPRKRRQKAQGA